MHIKRRLPQTLLLLGVCFASLVLFAADKAQASGKEPFKPTQTDLENRLYPLYVGHFAALVPLAHGSYFQPEGISETNGFYLKRAVIGDLNGDGKLDAVAEIFMPSFGNGGDYILNVFLNDGHRLVPLDPLVGGTVSFGDFHIVRGRILSKLTIPDEKPGTFITRSWEMDLVNKPMMHAETYQLAKHSMTRIDNSPIYLTDCAKEIQRCWLETKKRLIRISKTQKVAWSFPAHSKKPAVIVVNAPQTFVKSSSGDHVYDSYAYTAIVDALYEYRVPHPFISQPMPMEVAFLDDKVTCRDISPKLKPVALSDVELSNRHARTLDSKLKSNLIEQMKHFNYVLWNSCYKLEAKQVCNEHLKLIDFTIGDFSGDNNPDVVAHLRFEDNGSNRDGSNLIVPLLNHNGRLEQLPQECYILDSAQFYECGGFNVVGNIKVTQISIEKNRICVSWTGGRAKGLPKKADDGGYEQTDQGFGAPAPYVTVIDLTNRLMPQQHEEGRRSRYSLAEYPE